MEKFRKVTSIAAPFPLKDIDTDMILPAQHLTSTSRLGFDRFLFERLRSNPDFFLNSEKYRGANILVVGENFGCGSSREHAVWALMDSGYKAIIGTTFADIFSANSAKSGLLLIKLTEREVAELLAAAEAGKTVTVDLESETVSVESGKSYAFSYDPFRKTCLLEGKDDIDYLLSFHTEIAEHFSHKKALRL